MTLKLNSPAFENNTKIPVDYTPRPPRGRHQYFFKLSALDAESGDIGVPTKAELERAMRGHVLESAELIGTYEHG